MNYRKLGVISVIIIISVLLFGCTKKKTYNCEPLMGLKWYTKIDKIDGYVASLKLEAKREESDKIMLDYSDADLFGMPVSVTLCFDDRGLIGINYHDTKMGRTYVGWQRELENRYGIANENSIDCASWFENPVGENTSVYLFKLEEYIQISFYATEDIPDKGYERGKSKDQTMHLY